MKPLDKKIGYVMPYHVATKEGNPVILVEELKQTIKELFDELPVNYAEMVVCEDIIKNFKKHFGESLMPKEDK